MPFIFLWVWDLTSSHSYLSKSVGQGQLYIPITAIAAATLIDLVRSFPREFKDWWQNIWFLNFGISVLLMVIASFMFGVTTTSANNPNSVITTSLVALSIGVVFGFLAVLRTET